MYIQFAKLNGKGYDKNYITHKDIMSRGRLEFVMGSQPNIDWASTSECYPPSYSYGECK